MALHGDAAMVLFYDIAGFRDDHDDWHTWEHMHERLSVPGFLRASRWTANETGPRFMVIYEVAGTGVATSPDYLARLNAPTEWTSAMMERFRGMVRGFCSVIAGAGYGLGHMAALVRFTPAAGREAEVAERLSREAVPAMAKRYGIASVYLFRPAPPPPMTGEQRLRGADEPMRWMLLLTGYDAAQVLRVAAEHFNRPVLEALGVAPGMISGTYALQYTATAQEAARTPANSPLPPEARGATGTRR